MDDDSLSDLSSDLSSVRSVSPPLDYPSPVSSQDPESTGLASRDQSRKRPLDEEEGPAAKKRRRPEPKLRTTEFLDLTKSPSQWETDQKIQLDLLHQVLGKRRKIVVIAGAGISVSAGIPDFRSSTGLFKTLRSEHKLKASGKQLFDASVYQTDSSTSSFHDMVRSLSHLVSAAKPTVFHQMLSTLGSEGRLMRLYTQNVDGIDVALPALETNVPLSSKGPWPRTVQLHGGLEKMVCSKCSHLEDFAPALFDGPEPPPCGACVETDKVRTDYAGKRSHGIGRLRPRIVLYNEHNPDEEAIGAVVGSDLRARPDAVIVVGTSMKIPGVRRIVREMCGVVRGRRDGLTVWINQDGPPLGREFEDCWDLVVKGACDEVARHWSNDSKDHAECTESEVELAKMRTGELKVVVGSSQEENQAIPTPAPSPLQRPSKTGKIPTIKIRVTPLMKALQKVKGSKGGSTSGLKTSKGPAKSTGRPRKSAKISNPTQCMQKITQNFKVTKAVAIPSTRGPPKSMDSSLDEFSKHAPMIPISPSAARNNGPLSPTMFPNLIKPSSSFPSGRVPNDMAKLLN